MIIFIIQMMNEVLSFVKTHHMTWVKAYDCSNSDGTETQIALYSWPVRNSSKTQFSQLSLCSNEWSTHRILAQCIANSFQPKYSKWLDFRESLIQQCTNNGNQLLMLGLYVTFALCAMSECIVETKLKLKIVILD